MQNYSSDSAPCVLFIKCKLVCCFKMTCLLLYSFTTVWTLKKALVRFLQLRKLVLQVIRTVWVQDEGNVLSLIFNNNFHVTGSKSLFARITHLVVVLWRTITCFIDCFTFSLGLVPRFSCYSLSISKCSRSMAFWLKLRTKVKKVHHHPWSFRCSV